MVAETVEWGKLGRGMKEGMIGGAKRSKVGNSL